MTKPNWSEGLRLAAFLLFATAMLAAVSYGVGCLIFWSRECGLAHGLNWILHHPVFPTMIPAWTLFGFVVGAFGGVISAVIPDVIKSWLARHKGAIAWIFTIALIAGFLLWGLPDLMWALEFLPRGG